MQDVAFRVPVQLIDQLAVLAAVRDTDRSAIIVTAVRVFLEEATTDEALQQELAAAYYGDEITDEQLTALVGAAEAANFWVLKEQLAVEFVEEVVESFVELS